MRNAILLHGMQDENEYYDPSFPAPGNAHWLPWLQKQLLIRDIYAETPNVPDVYSATYSEWVHTVERCLKIDEDTMLVGHSCGGGFWIRFLSEHPEVKVGKVILVAPWIDPDKDPNYDVRRNGFFDFTIDTNMIKRTRGITVFVSNDDHKSILKTVEMIEKSLNGVKIIRFEDKKHFCIEDMGTQEFPELLFEALE